MRHWLGVLALALALPWAAAGQPTTSAPVVDRTQPAAVAQAYLDALRRADSAAVRQLSLRDRNLDLFLTLFIGEVTRGPQGQILSEAGLAELALFPMPNASPLTLGEARPADGGQMSFDLTRQVQLKPKLVLARQADGTWAVDLAASLRATAPEGKSGVLALASMMGSVPEGVIAEPEEEQPWQCMSRLRELAQSLRAFAEEHGGTLPTAATWYDELLPYLDNPQALICPDHDDEEFGYAFNTQLGGTKLGNDWEQQRRTVALACAKGDRANMTFAADQVEALRGRHGKSLVYATATGETMVLPVDWTFDRLWRDQEQAQNCAARLRALVEAAKQYAKAHDGKLPPAEEWVEALRPLVAKPRDGGSPFCCPAADNAALVSYAYLPAVAGKRLAGLVNHRKVVLFREVAGAEGSPLAVDGAPGPTRHHCEWNNVRRSGFGYEATLDGGTRTVAATPAEPVAAGR